MAYTYKVETMYLPGIPQTRLASGPLRPAGISMHWTAGAVGRRGAVATAQFFIDRADRNASYHVLVWWENRTFGVLWIVPVANAAHSMNPAPPTYAPNAEVKRILGSRVGDPNAACIAVSFCGMPADLAEAMKDPDFLLGYRRLISELSAISTMSPRPMFNHGWAQPTTRTDAGNLIAAINGVVPASTGGTMFDWVDSIKPEFFKVVIQEGSAIRKAPTLVPESFHFTAPRDSTLTCIGTVPGASYQGSTEWWVYPLGAGGLRVVHSANMVAGGSKVPYVPGQVLETVKEVIKEVPTGITEADVTLAEAKAIANERLRIRKILEL